MTLAAMIKGLETEKDGKKEDQQEAITVEMEAQATVTTVEMERNGCRLTCFQHLYQEKLSSDWMGLNKHWHLAQNGHVINLINELMETKAQYG